METMRSHLGAALAVTLLLPSVWAGAPEPAMSLTLTTPAFEAGGAIPKRHTCDGEDLSPELRWTEPPAGTKTLALVVNDPDAPVGDWVHWVVYDLPPSLRGLPSGIARDGALADPKGARQGINDFGRIGWGGPCPPPGKPHRYYFRIYALDVPAGLAPGATRSELERAMKGHVLAQAEMHGTYARARR